MTGKTPEKLVSKLANELAEWVIEKHNFFIRSSNQDFGEERLLEQLLEQRQKVRTILGKAGKAGILNSILPASLGILSARRDQLEDLTEEQTAALDADIWSPEMGVLPEPFDLILGQGKNRKRYISLGGGKWAKIPVEMSVEDVQALRDKVQQENPDDEEMEQVEVSDNEAFSHAQFCLFEALHYHLNRVALRMTHEEENRDWILGGEIPASPDNSPVCHELMGVVVAGNTEMTAFSSPSFAKLVAEHMNADPAMTKLVGAVQLTSSFGLLSNVQGLWNFSDYAASRLATDREIINPNDLEFLQLREDLGLVAPEAFDDIEDVSLLVFSVVRRETGLQALWEQGGVDLTDTPDDENHAMWVHAVTGWMEQHQIMNTYVMPPDVLVNSICQLGAAHLSILGNGTTSLAAAIGMDNPVPSNALIEVVVFDKSEEPMLRGKAPAWMFGLMEYGVAQQAHELFGLDVDILPSDVELDLDSLPQAHPSEEETIEILSQRSTKRTLH